MYEEKNTKRNVMNDVREIIEVLAAAGTDFG